MAPGADVFSLLLGSIATHSAVRSLSIGIASRETIAREDTTARNGAQGT